MKYAFCGGKLLDGTREMQPREGLVLRTDGDRITDIVPEGTDLTGYEVVNLKGGYLMPGLINMHVHLAGSGKPQKKQRDNEKLVKTILSTGLTRKVAYGMVAGFAKEELFSGVTTITGCMIYALFFYRAKITWRRIILAKLLTNIQNVLLGALWSAILYSKGYLYYLTQSAVKNALYLPLQILLLGFLLQAVLPVMQRQRWLPEQLPGGRLRW